MKWIWIVLLVLLPLLSYGQDRITSNWIKWYRGYVVTDDLIMHSGKVLYDPKIQRIALYDTTNKNIISFGTYGVKYFVFDDNIYGRRLFVPYELDRERKIQFVEVLVYGKISLVRTIKFGPTDEEAIASINEEYHKFYIFYSSLDERNKTTFHSFQFNGGPIKKYILSLMTDVPEMTEWYKDNKRKMNSRRLKINLSALGQILHKYNGMVDPDYYNDLPEHRI